MLRLSQPRCSLALLFFVSLHFFLIPDFLGFFDFLSTPKIVLDHEGCLILVVVLSFGLQDLLGLLDLLAVFILLLDGSRSLILDFF